MVQTFPLTILKPHWVSDPIVPELASVDTKFLNGAVSSLRLSDTASSATFKMIWNDISDADVAAITNFWESVGTNESFTIATSVFSDALPTSRITIIQNFNKTGLWRFRERPQIEWINLESSIVTATIQGHLI
jgi:hypothetical protein